MDAIVAVTLKSAYRDRHGEHVRHDAAAAGVAGVRSVSSALLYRIAGDITDTDLHAIAGRLLTDPITETYAVYDAVSRPALPGAVHIWFRKGVTDTVAESVVKAIADLGITVPLTVHTGHRFVFAGAAKPAALRQVTERLLANPMIQEYTVG